MATSAIRDLPLTLLIDPNGYWDLIDDLAQVCRESGCSTLLRTGLVLGPDGLRTAVSLSEFKADTGREVVSEQYRRLPGQMSQSLDRLWSEVSAIQELDGMTHHDILRSECISFSSISDIVARELIELCVARQALISAWRWSTSKSHAGTLLWTQLLLRRVVTDGIVVTHYEEYPDNARVDGDQLVWSPDRPPRRADGFFFDSGGVIYLESALSNIPLPDDLRISRPGTPRSTPLQRAIASVGASKVLRRSGYDLADETATYELPDLSHQYPDLLATERKVRQYCLNPQHELRKWEGFELHGWGWRSTDSVVVAANICGALLGDFNPEEAIATSAGDLQFSVGVLIPSLHGLRMPLTTAWVAQPGRAFRLSTAFVSHDRTEYADQPRIVAPGADLNDVWDELLLMTKRMAQRWTGDSVRARPMLFIQRSGIANALTKRLVKDRVDHGTFNHPAAGGRVLLVPIGPVMPWSAAAAAASFAQIQMGLHGVKSEVYVWVD